MPSCVCGNFFTTTSYNINNKEDDICPSCKDASTPTSYTSSYQWVCEGTTNLLFDSSFSVSGGSNE